MGPATPFIMLGLGAVSIYQGIQANEQAQNIARQQEELARQNAIAVEAEARESERRARVEQAAAMGESRARAAASGVTAGGSLDLFMSEQDRLFEMEIDWLRKSAQSQSQIARMGGQVQSSITQTQGRQQMISGVTGGVRQGITAGSDAGWW